MRRLAASAEVIELDCLVDVTAPEGRGRRAKHPSKKGERREMPSSKQDAVRAQAALFEQFLKEHSRAAADALLC